jgi:acyl-CoA thioesterase
MSFASLLDVVRSSSGEVVVPASWAQGRAAFGGLVAGLLYEGMRMWVGGERLLRSFSVSFVGPVAPDVPLTVDARVLREGRAVSQVHAQLVQGDQVMAAALASFGIGRESHLQVPASPPPQVRRPEESPAWEYVEGRAPVFTRHFDWRWAIGSLPFAGVPDREMGGWIRFRERQPAIAEGHLLGLIDAWPPAVLPMMTIRAPASSLTWTVDFIQPLPAIRWDQWVLYRAWVDHGRDGYGQVGAHIWGPGGDLIAVSRQTVAVFS